MGRRIDCAGCNVTGGRIRNTVLIDDRSFPVRKIDRYAGAAIFGFRSLNSNPKNGTRELLSMEKLLPSIAQPHISGLIAENQQRTIANRPTAACIGLPLQLNGNSKWLV